MSLCLASNFPINIIWGPGHTQIYNEGYRSLCGDIHPRALGEDYSVTWASAWPAIGVPFARALAGETRESDGNGNGSVFEIRLPVAAAPLCTTPPVKASEQRRLRILIVDDNEDSGL